MLLLDRKFLDVHLLNFELIFVHLVILVESVDLMP